MPDTQLDTAIDSPYTVPNIIRGGFWLYLSSLVNNASGFLYWMIISAIAGPNTLGYTSATISFAILITGILGIGMTTGMQRFLGQAIGERNKEKLKTYFWSTTCTLFAIYIVAGAIFLTLGNQGIGLGGMSPQVMQLAAVVVILGFGGAFQALIVSTLRTEYSIIVAVVGNAIKLGVGTYLVLAGWGWVGATIGYLGVSVTMIVIGFIYAVKVVNVAIVFSLKAVKEVIKAGVVSWLPAIVVLIGRQLGVLSVFGFSGAVETGHYYVAFAIANLTLMVATSMISPMLPALSGMVDGRKRVSWSILKVGLAVSMPISAVLLAYPWIPLSLLGSKYVVASDTLRLLILATAPIALTGTVTNLTYAYGHYKHVLEMGLAQNIPRLILYPILIPIYGGLGAAISYLAGSLIGMSNAVLIAKKIKYKIPWKEAGIIISIPLAIATLSWKLIPNQWIIGTAVIMVIAVAIYLKTGLITIKEIKGILKAIIF
jgi:O-antigen/teichoic acid export membrane protein